MPNICGTRKKYSGLGTILCRRVLSFAGALLILITVPSFAASSKGCTGGGFSLFGLSGNQKKIVLASDVGGAFLVKGKYVEFTVDSATFGVRDWTLTGAPNVLDITGGRRTVIFTAKIPDHRGLFLNSDVSVKINKESVVIERTGSGLSMKIQAKDCANGGLFQMEPERADEQTPDLLTFWRRTSSISTIRMSATGWVSGFPVRASFPTEHRLYVTERTRMER